MRKRIVLFLLLLGILTLLCSCSDTRSDSYFRVTFIDVGQGDSALVECDGKYMLIDAGIKSAGNAVVDVLEQKKIRNIDILVASHLHNDHIGGMIPVLDYLRSYPDGSQKTLVLGNSGEIHSGSAENFMFQLDEMGLALTVPNQGETYELGSASIKVLDVCDTEENDSLVLLITYRDTRFLFTGDIERNGQLRAMEALQQDQQHAYGSKKEWNSIIKMPHHGAFNDEYGFNNSALQPLLNEYDPTYFVISVGENNRYHHPHEETISMIWNLLVKAKGLDWDSHVFRTDEHGNIIMEVLSDGRSLKITTSRP